MGDSDRTHKASTGLKRRSRSSSDDIVNNPSRKKPRTTIRKRLLIRVRSMLQEIPLELVFEILQYLEPSDLLKLVWVNKDFRSLLMSRSSTFLWRRARINADDMPNPAFGLSEPAHAHLIFVNYCSYCQTRCDKVIWECSIRCCKKCMKTRFISLGQALQQYYTLRQIIFLVPRQMKDLLFVDVLDQYTAELSQFEGDTEATEQWISCKIEQCINTKAYITACAQWEARRKHRLQIEREIARQSRIEWIEEKADAEGWQIEMKSYRITKGRTVGSLACNSQNINKKNKSDLVEGDWLKLRSSILEPLKTQRKLLLGQAMDRRLKILTEVYSHFEISHPGNPIWPSLGDLIVRDGPIKELLQSTPLDRDPSVTMRDCEFRLNVSKTLLSPRFAGFSFKWRFDKEMELYQMLCDAVPSTHNGNDLCLATTVYRCNAPGCGFALYYPDIFRHRCTTSYDFDAWWDIAPGIIPRYSYSYESYVVSSLPELNVRPDLTAADGFLAVQETGVFDCFKILKTQDWNHGGKRISFYHRGSELVRRLFTNDPYLDPLTTTVQQLKSCSFVITCRTCLRRLNDWSELGQHDDMMHDLMIEWPEKVSFPRHSGHPIVHSNSWVYGSRCKLCEELLHPSAVACHLLDVHDIGMIDSEYWYMDFSKRLPA
ncbi:hypothetical protein EV361DRAFT_915862 [Lentinula raphanica]|nr:hypothetical protein F5880DRAFT_203942 [Lentinula raphanica]KAJ3970438.1 hypothetical protein EV361DRAFT_915862 [Lentinula raphanica]